MKYYKLDSLKYSMHIVILNSFQISFTKNNYGIVVMFDAYIDFLKCQIVLKIKRNIFDFKCKCEINQN